MLPLRPPAGKPAPLVCTYAATGHNSAVLSLDVTEDLMFTGSKGWFLLCMSAVRYGICMCTCYSFLDWVVLVKQYTTNFYGLQADKPHGMLIEREKNFWSVLPTS